MVQIASGDWRKSLCHQVEGRGHDILYQTLYAGGGILWQKDCEFDEESNAMKQLVKGKSFPIKSPDVGRLISGHSSVWRIGDIQEVRKSLGWNYAR